MAEIAGRKVSDIRMTQRLLADLGIDGDDAHALLKEIAVQFDVDFESFVWLRYFGDEGWDLFAPTITALRCTQPAFARRWRAAKDAEREITVSHLAEVISARKWIESDMPRQLADHGWAQGVLAVVMSIAGITMLVVPAVYLAAIFTEAPAASDRLGMWAGFIAFLAVAAFLLRSSWRNVSRKADSG